MDPRAQEIAAHERRLAVTEFDGYSDLYAHLARAIAADAEVLKRLSQLPTAPKVLPVLLFAAVHDLVLAEPDQPLARWYGAPNRDLGAGLDTDRNTDLSTAPYTDGDDPWPVFHQLLVERFADIATTMTTRVIQTNEVGRAAPVLVALTELHQRLRRPLWLIEIGASAGLNLLLDRFGYSFPPSAGATVGDPRSPVQLRCEVRGHRVPPVVEPTELALVGSVGIDPRPVDVTNPRDRRWLAACLWPGVTDRAAHLAAALELAQDDPPEVRRGNALDLLDAAIDEVPAGAVPCIVSTWVLAYLSKDERRAMHVLLARHGRARDMACVTGEYQGIPPWVPLSTPGNGVRATELGIATWTDGQERCRAAARIQPHGRWIDWQASGILQ